MADIQKSKAAMRRLYDELPAAMSAATGEPWHATFGPAGEDDRERWFALAHSEGSKPRFSIHAGHDAGRITVSLYPYPDCNGDRMFFGDIAEWNPEKMAREQSPEISASLSKSPAQIARDIVLRILPAAVQAFEKLDAEAQRRQQARTAHIEALAAAKACGASISDMGRKPERRTGSVKAASGETVYLDVQPYGSIEIKLTLSSGPEQAEKLRRILAAV